MAALGVHQHGVDRRCGSRFHLNHGPFGRPGDVGRCRARLSIRPSIDRRRGGAARARRRGPPSSSKGTSGERSMRAGRAAPRRLPAAARRSAKGSGAQVLARRPADRRRAGRRDVRRSMLRRHGLAVEPLLQVGEGLRPRPSRGATSNSPSSAALEVQRLDQIGEGRRDVVAGARIEPPRRRRPATACTRMPSHFHSATKSAGSSAARSPSSSGWASITGRNGAGRAGARPRPALRARRTDRR